MRISSTTIQRLSPALSTYIQELTELIDPIRRQAQFAGRPPENYIPHDLSYEHQAARECIQVLHHIDDTAQLFGVQISEIHLRVMSSALALRRDDLQTRLAAIEADPLSPEQARSPLRDEIDAMDREMKRFWSQYGSSEWLAKLRARRELKSGLAYPREVDLDAVVKDGEGQKMEFIEKFPEQAHDLAKEIAAFGTTNPGIVLLGVANSGIVSGLQGVRGPKDQDQLRARVEGVSSNAIIPSLPVRVQFVRLRRKLVAAIHVPKGPEPVYYTKNGVPYIRHGSLSRPALPQEVNELVRRHLEREKAALNPTA